MLKTKAMNLLIGATGVASTELVQVAEAVSPEQIGAAGNIIIQIIIGIATLIGLFKKRK